MEIILAKKSGYCKSVKRAMDMAFEELTKNNDVYALGPLIHNKQAIQKCEEKGLLLVDNIEDIKKDSTVMLRIHGVSEDMHNALIKNNLNILQIFSLNFETCFKTERWTSVINILFTIKPIKKSCAFLRKRWK